MLSDRWVRSARPAADGRYPEAAMAASTRSRVSGFTIAGLLMTLEMV